MTVLYLPDGTVNPGSLASAFSELETKLDEMGVEIDTIGFEFETAVGLAKKSLCDASGRLDRNKLKDYPTRESFYEALATSMREYTKKRIGLKAGDLLEDRFVETIFGISPGALKSQIDSAREKIFETMTQRVIPYMDRQVREHLEGDYFAPVTHEWAEGFVKYIQAEDVLDPAKMNKEDIISVFKMFKEQGTVTKKMLEGARFLKN